jgi:hypothetical protein
LSQTAIKLRSSLNEVLYTLATADPSVNDDRNDGYIIGSRWVNTTSKEEFVCVDNTNIAAVWKNTTSGSGGGFIPVIDTVDPTVNDDAGDGHAIGTVWINTSTATVFMATDVSVGAAVWSNLSSGGGGAASIVDTVDPTVNDDSTDGNTIGTMWVNSTTDTVFIAVDVTASAAIWLKVTNDTASKVVAVPSAGNTGVTVQQQLDNINNAIANIYFVGRLSAVLALFTETFSEYITIVSLQNTHAVFSDTYSGFSEGVREYVSIAAYYLSSTAIDGFNTVAF